jgi:CDP-glycerol glycerophosphotransferase (TagB/SpsB family)
MQKVDILNGSDCMIEYEDNYDFTLYDLMAYTDCVITDYSSIGYDFLLTDRPLIFNLYDLELYERKRGLSYDPYVDFCPGHIVTNWSEMKQAMQDVLCGRDPYAEQRQRVTRLLHKYRDDHSTERVIEYFDTLLR